MICNRFYNKFFIIILIAFIMLFNPKVVSANIMCNDGSRSPSCSDCHQGCCSHHGGCAEDYENSEEIVGYDESDDDNSSDSSGIILSLLIGGGIAGAVALGNKNKSKFIDK